MKRVISAMLIITMLLVGAAVAESDFEPIAKGARETMLLKFRPA